MACVSSVANEYVVDASVVVSALGSKDTTHVAVHQRIADADCHAPHLLDAEVGHVLRRSERLGKIGADWASSALAALPELIDHRYEHTGRLAESAWRLRHTITFCDGLYVALAAILAIPLLTADRRLFTVDLPCAVELLD